SSTSRFFRKILFILVWTAGRPIFLCFNRTAYKRSNYILLSKIIRLLMTGRNQEITPHVRNYFVII
ncbi:NAD(P)H-quinone oxidoreductase subunit 2 b chloroplastic, partial [Phtheirospermum japonicum]